MNVIKRSGEEVSFDANKIIVAISKANKATNGADQISDSQITDITNNVIQKCNNTGRAVSVEEIQDMVENGLMELGAYALAKNYITYRYEHALARKANTTDKQILALLGRTNEELKQENSNKNPAINSTQRDYMAGEVSKDISKRFIIPADLWDAHEKGLIHIHDTDYLAQPMYNCFGGNTKFITNEGVRKFNDCKDGEQVVVLDKDAVWRQATVHKYQKNKLYDVIFKCGRTMKKVVCTKDHRWILKNGSVTTELKIGDSLYPLHDLAIDLPKTKRNCEMFALGMIIGDGCNDYKNHVRIRLCGNKTKYLPYFEKACYRNLNVSNIGDDVILYNNHYDKQLFLSTEAWKYLTDTDKQMLFLGYYSADGNGEKNICHTADERVLKMIEDISAVAGYHITSVSFKIHDTPYKKNAYLYTVHFMKHQHFNHCWKVISIKPHRKGSDLQDSWCVEEPITHSFTLEGGMVTGNCSLINLEDMLQNGTCISGTTIDKPHSFATACNIATQIIAQVASNQYGGQTITLSHLAPFVDVSRQKIRKSVIKELSEINVNATDEIVHKLTEERLAKEISAGVQTIQYQIITLMTTNGQAPFVTVFMYLDEVPEGQTRDDLALIIEEMLKQRIKGVKNEKGVYITPAFPKLIYCLDEDNIYDNSKYYYLTKLAAECTAKRMVPDYISAKIMKELKGDTYPCMGCVDGKEVITYKFNNTIYTESFERMWDRLAKYYPVELQNNKKDFVMKTAGVQIYDQKEGFVDNYGVIKNHNSDWLRITFSNGRVITCTPDHPFENTNGKIVYARDLTKNDLIEIDKTTNLQLSPTHSVKTNRAWLYGFALCDTTYYDSIIASIAISGEDEIQNAFIKTLKDEYNLPVKVVERHRGVKGNYKDLFVCSNGKGDYQKLRIELATLFEGKAKNDRHIPNEVFSWEINSKLAFLAGMIDADGYLNTSGKKAVVQIGSTNKELAIQQALLAQSCGMFAKVYLNHYKSNTKDNIRYRVEFTPTYELISFIKCNKKTNLNKSILENPNHSVANTDTCHITNVERIYDDSFSYDVTTSSEHFTVSGVYSHNCRSFLTPDRFTDNGWENNEHALNSNGKHKYYGRFNQGVCTINLVDVACSSGRDMDKFWQIFDERLDMCYRVLMIRHNRLKGTPSDVAPILWQYGAMARLKKGETIDKLLYNGYSTISLGYGGLAECVRYMLGVSHTSPEGEKLGLAVMQHLNDACEKWKKETNIDFSVYGTPMESTTYKFAKCLQARFGIIDGVTNHNYITNSYHVHVTEEINAFDKLTKESKFQKLSPGGAISYVEVPNMQNNIQAVLAIMKHIYNTIMYAELNTKSDYCQVCGYTGEIQIEEDENKKLIWRCPNCGNTDQTKMNVARRTCGYIGTQFWNQGRTQEIKERVLHL